MKLKLSVLIFLLAAPLLPAQTNNLTALLQQGLFEEQANRNLDAAIIDYQSLALQFDKDRQLAATAIFRLGECYRAQGKTNEAAAQYQRILRDFSDQTTLATLSGQDLAGMGQSAVQNPLKATTQSVSENNVEQMRELEIVKKLQAMPLAQINQLAPTLLADGTLINLIDQFNQGELAKRPTPVLNEIGDRIHERLDGISQALTLELGLTGNVAAAASTNTLSSGSDTIDDEAKEIIRIQQLIQNSPDLINTAVPGGTTPLATAAAHGWLKVATYLLDHGADANVSAVAHVSPLIEATKAGNRAMVELLLSRGANLNSTGDWGENSVHIAAENNFPAVLDVLLDKGADVNALDGPENTPLVRAAEKGNQAIASLLLAHHANVNTKNYLGETALITAARSNSPQIVKQLLGAGAEPNTLTEKGRTALSYAAANGSPEMVKILLEAKADPNGGTLDAPLVCAIHKEDPSSAEMLLQTGANPNAKGKIDWDINVSGRLYNPPFGSPEPALVTPLYQAVYTKQPQMVRLLAKYKAGPNDSQTDGQSLLFSAFTDTNTLAALLDVGANVDSTRPDESHYTLLACAIAQNYAPPIEILLKHGANPNLGYPSGTFLHWAANGRDTRKIMQLLLAYKADPNVRNNEGKTPLDLIKNRLADPSMSAEQKTIDSQLADLLRQHGALDNLPNWDAITVSRPLANFSKTLFTKGSNDWNQFTLLELVAVQYHFLSAHPNDRGENADSTVFFLPNKHSLPFPDFTQIRIRRPSSDSKTWKDQIVDLSPCLMGGDCSKDMPIRPGDIVEIPESDHPLYDQWLGFSVTEMTNLQKCLTRQVQIIVKGQAHTVTLSPKIKVYVADNIAGSPVLTSINSEAPYWLGPVLFESDLILSSSDLSRVKVTRHDSKTGKILEWIIDYSDHPQSSFNAGPGMPIPVARFGNPRLRGQDPSSYNLGNYNLGNNSSSSDFWLRDGDVIEVPEKVSVP